MSSAAEFDHIFRLLDCVKRTPQPNRWTARCPAHHDEHPSLSIHLDDAGILAVKCHGPGCTFEEIRAALSLRYGSRLFFQPYNGQKEGRKPRRRIEPIMNIVATYPYTDEDGEILFETVRLEPKDFRQRRPNPDYGSPGESRNEQYFWDLTGVRRVLFNLPDLVANVGRGEQSRIVWIMEGERDCLTAAGLGLLATTNVCGSKKFKMAETDVLKGMRVVVPFDLDKVDPKRCEVVGLEHALQIVNCLHGKAASVQLLRLPAPDHKGEFSVGAGDFTDWAEGYALDAVNPEIRRERTRRALWDLVRAAPCWDPWGPILTREEPEPFLRRVLDAQREIEADVVRGHIWRPDELVAEMEKYVSFFKKAVDKGFSVPYRERCLKALADAAACALSGVKNLRWHDEEDNKS